MVHKIREKYYDIIDQIIFDRPKKKEVYASFTKGNNIVQLQKSYFKNKTVWEVDHKTYNDENEKYYKNEKTAMKEFNKIKSFIKRTDFRQKKYRTNESYHGRIYPSCAGAVAVGCSGSSCGGG